MMKINCKRQTERKTWKDREKKSERKSNIYVTMIIYSVYNYYFMKSEKYISLGCSANNYRNKHACGGNCYVHVQELVYINNIAIL